MVMGHMQLGVLRKLKENGAMQSGVHPTVNMLVREGFVNYSDDVGFSISETGELALLAYGEMSEFHREIIMRLHRAAVDGRDYKKSALKEAFERECFDDLLLWDLVDIDDFDSITLTDAGRMLWEIAQKAYGAKDDAKQGNFAQVNEAKRLKKAEKEATKRIVTEPKTWVETRFENEKPTLVEQVRLDSVATAENAGYPMPEAADCPDCGDCVHAEVLELIAAKYPKVAELRDALLKQKEILKELGL